jgi:hypothetical protein
MKKYCFDRDVEAARTCLYSLKNNPIFINPLFQKDKPLTKFKKGMTQDLPDIIVSSLPTSFEWPEDIALSLPSVASSWDQTPGPSRQYCYKSPELANNVAFFTQHAEQYYAGLSDCSTIKTILKSRRDSRTGTFFIPYVFLTSLKLFSIER